MNLKEKRAAAIRAAQTIIDTAKADGRDLTAAEHADIEAKHDDIENLTTQIDRAERSADHMSRIKSAAAANRGEMDMSPPPEAAGKSGRGSMWAKSVSASMRAAGDGMAVKSLLSGAVSTPSAVEVAALPDVPTRLLDLVPRQELAEATFAYLRQTAKENAADVVADGETKPTSAYEFTEIEDRARVIAHLSEPFPVRFVEDHASMLDVLDGQMRTGVLQAVEAMIVNGTGEGEEWSGITATTGVGSVPFAGDPLTTLRRARTELETVGVPVTGVALHPGDVEALDMLRDNEGRFLVSEDVFARIFGRGVRGVPSVAVPRGQAIVGDWTTTRLRVRQGAHTLAATQGGDLFDTNRMKLRAEGRFGFQIGQPGALAVVELVDPAA